MQSKLMQYGLLAMGWLAVFLGVLGIVLPVLPTTPFILLAAACFAKSSPKFYQWLLNHKYFSQMIIDYQKYRGVSRKVKIRAISCMWFTMSLSAFIMAKPWLTLCLLCSASLLSLYMWRMPEPPLLEADND